MSLPFKTGFYFDLYSDNRKDWQIEADFNRRYNPDFLEVMLEFPLSTELFDESCAQDLLKIVDPIPLTVHGPTLGISLCNYNRRIIEASQIELINGLKVCKMLGTNMYTIHGGEFPFTLLLNNTSPAKEFIKNVQPILEEADRMNIHVCLENLKGEKIFPKSFEDLDEVFSACPTLKLALDVRHLCINKMDVMKTYEKYKDRTLSIQYRDDCGLTDEQLHNFLKALINDKWSGNFITEDPALNTADKKEKPMLDAGHKRISEILEKSSQEIGV